MRYDYLPSRPADYRTYKTLLAEEIMNIGPVAGCASMARPLDGNLDIFQAACFTLNIPPSAYNHV